MRQKILFQGLDGKTKKAYLESPLKWYQRLWNWFLRDVCRQGTVWQTAIFDESQTTVNGDELKITYTITRDDSQPVPMSACEAFNAVPFEDEDDDGVAI
jgi:hypothetical protein